MLGSVSGTASSLAVLAIVVCRDGAAESCGEVDMAAVSGMSADFRMSVDFRLSLRRLVNRFIV